MEEESDQLLIFFHVKPDFFCNVQVREIFSPDGVIGPFAAEGGELSFPHPPSNDTGNNLSETVYLLGYRHIIVQFSIYFPQNITLNTKKLGFNSDGWTAVSG